MKITLSNGRTYEVDDDGANDFSTNISSGKSSSPSSNTRTATPGESAADLKSRRDWNRGVWSSNFNTDGTYTQRGRDVAGEGSYRNQPRADPFQNPRLPYNQPGKNTMYAALPPAPYRYDPLSSAPPPQQSHNRGIWGNRPPSSYLPGAGAVAPSARPSWWTPYQQAWNGWSSGQQRSQGNPWVAPQQENRFGGNRNTWSPAPSGGNRRNTTNPSGTRKAPSKSNEKPGGIPKQRRRVK